MMYLISFGSASPAWRSQVKPTKLFWLAKASQRIAEQKKIFTALTKNSNVHLLILVKVEFAASAFLRSSSLYLPYPYCLAPLLGGGIKAQLLLLP